MRYRAQSRVAHLPRATLRRDRRLVGSNRIGGEGLEGSPTHLACSPIRCGCVSSVPTSILDARLLVMHRQSSLVLLLTLALALLCPALAPAAVAEPRPKG